MTDADLLALNMFQEANLEPDEGLAAIAFVALERTRLHYQSDGTLQDTILRHDQFSWTEHQMVGGAYKQTAFGLSTELARAQALLTQDEAYSRAWARCEAIRDQVQARTFHGPLYDQLVPGTVLYANLSICTPSWLPNAVRVVAIGHHTFFRDATVHVVAPSGITATKAAIGA